VAADRVCAVTFYGDFVIVQSGIGRKGSSGWAMEHAGTLMRPTDEELGEAVIRSLATSHKVQSNALLRPVTDSSTAFWLAVGAPSKRAFINASRMVFVNQRSRRLFRRERTFFYPSRTVPDEGHSVVEDRELVSVDQSARGMGNGVREALELCS
jgi:hypothetical protein